MAYSIPKTGTTSAGGWRYGPAVDFSTMFTNIYSPEQYNAGLLDKVGNPAKPKSAQSPTSTPSTPAVTSGLLDNNGPGGFGPGGNALGQTDYGAVIGDPTASGKGWSDLTPAQQGAYISAVPGAQTAQSVVNALMNGTTIGKSLQTITSVLDNLTGKTGAPNQIAAPIGGYLGGLIGGIQPTSTNAQIANGYTPEGWGNIGTTPGTVATPAGNIAANPMSIDPAQAQANAIANEAVNAISSSDVADATFGPDGYNIGLGGLLGGSPSAIGSGTISGMTIGALSDPASTAQSAAETNSIGTNNDVDLGDVDTGNDVDIGDTGTDVSVGVNGGGGGGGGDKIICTAMNEAYGFGSYRQAVWLKYSERMTPEHERGYHKLFLPLVKYAFKSGDGFGKRIVRKVLEHGTRHRTADLRAEMYGRKRDTLGRIYRAIFEPICYVVGKG